MEKHLIRQLVKTALVTAPLIAVIYCTPFYVFKVIPGLSFFIILPLFTIPILVSWFINIAFLKIVKAKWATTYLRTVIIILFMLAMSEIPTRLLKSYVPIDIRSVLIVRFVNIISVNSIIHILIMLLIERENKNKVELENANLKLVKLEAEYKLLKDQINPHFLFNALSTAKALIKPQPALAEEYIVRLSDFLRASIKNNKKTVTIKEELSLCADFIALNQIRFGEALKVQYTISIDQEKNYVPYFALLTLIENAIKHNTFTVDEPLQIEVSSTDTHLEVRNNKKSKFVLENSSKTGLTNLNERYKLISSEEISITDTNDHYSVKLPILKS